MTATPLAYSGQLVRQNTSAHYSGHVPVAGVDPAHTKPTESEDVFEPEHPAADQPGDVWQPSDLPTHTEMRVEPVTHVTRLAPPVPTNVPSERAGIETTRRMLANHSVVDYRPHTVPQYKHAGEGMSIEYVPGRPPTVAGETVPEESAYLQMGQNGYDRTNQPNEVYSAGESNVGRYRLGTDIRIHGAYTFHTRQGQDPQLRAYSGLTPAFPVAKPRLDDYAPYTPPSSGTDTWTLPPFQEPSFFALPSETSMTDHEVADGTPMAPEFTDEGRL